MHTDGLWIKDDEGRSLILRGVNLSGSTKVPAQPDGASYKRESLLKPKEVSFIGKPFPLDQADEHFHRLKHWGLTFLRFLITWEAIEHRGPGLYDEEYLAYLEAVIKKARDYGINVFIDPHNDMWSRWTGGDGAPGWTMELLGMDITQFHATGSAFVHGYHNGKLPGMIWVTNETKLGTSTMFTLFFGGNDFAPHTLIQGEPVQEFLQRHYLNAIRQVALRLKNIENIAGYETLNEPFEGFIGHKNLATCRPFSLRLGLCPTPFQSMVLASGCTMEIPYYEIKKLLPKRRGRVAVNTEKVKLWKDGYECVWKQNGVWSDESGKPLLLQPSYFYSRHGRKVNFEHDYLKPFMIRFLKQVRAVQPKAIIFLGSVPRGKRVMWSENDGKNVVNADHWYDGKTLFFKKFTPGFTVINKKYLPLCVWGKTNVKKAFVKQLADIKQTSVTCMKGIPTLIGEFGLPFDMENKKAYSNGDFSLHSEAMDLYFQVMDQQLLSCTIWNYTPDNTNQHGDLWNEEDFSIFSNDQRTEPQDINSGGRAIPGFCRPYARKTAGIPLAMCFDLKTRIFTFRFCPDPAIKAPTEIFIPSFHYPEGFLVWVSEGEWENDKENNGIAVYASGNAKECKVVIRPDYCMCYSK
ncbi:MAG: cellulase family glycosylhydrolase [Spirochaetales bacterium]|nr:cellulase family glycosylhydrolase [Spirochaetales bacterium]